MLTDHVWMTPGDSGGGETEYDVDTRAELFWEAQGGSIVYQGRDMHILSAVNLRINGKHVRLTALPGLPAFWLSAGSRTPQWARLGCARAARLWQFCTCQGNHHKMRRFRSPFPLHPLGGRRAADPSHQELATGAAFVIGTPQSFCCREGDGMLVWEGAVGKPMHVEYSACEWVNPYLEKGVWVLQARFLDSCAQQLTPNTQAAPLLPRQVVAYEGVTLLPAMVCMRMWRLCASSQVVGRQYRWGGCGFTLRITCTQQHSTPLLVNFPRKPVVSSVCVA